VRLTYGGATLTASGTVGGTPSDQLSVTLDDRVEDLLPLLALSGAHGTWAGEGSVHARVLVGGPVWDPRVSGELSLVLATLRRDDREIARDFALRATLSDTALQLVEVSGLALGGAVQGHGLVPLPWLIPGRGRHRSHEVPPDDAATFTGSWQLDLESALTSLGLGGPQLGGKVTLSLEAHAPGPQFEAIQASLTGVAEQVTARKVLLVERAPLALRLRGGGVEVDALDWEGREGSVSVSGVLGVAAGVESNLRLRGHALARIADYFFPVRADGRVSFDLRLSGVPGTSRTSGTLTVANGSLIVPRSRIALADWSGTLVLTAESMGS
jgi:hypothetical protein